MKRRTFVSGSAALAAAGFVSTTAQAASIKPYSWDLNPPTDTRENFIAWGKSRGNRLATGRMVAAASAVRRESRRFTGFLVVH